MTTCIFATPNLRTNCLEILRWQNVGMSTEGGAQVGQVVGLTQPSLSLRLLQAILNTDASPWVPNSYAKSYMSVHTSLPMRTEYMSL